MKRLVISISSVLLLFGCSSTEKNVGIDVEKIGYNYTVKDSDSLSKRKSS